MTRLTISLAAATALVGGLATVPTPAIAQAGQGQGTITIYGNDPCPAQNICIRAPESQRYRLPQSQNPQGTRQERESWANKAQTLNSIGNTGAQSCSNVGPGGFTGCVVQSINQAKRERKEQQEQDTPPEK
ncbi:MAG TPA: hypothetical protein VF098_05390 [Sphingomicrobium sp.]|jgi:hypothetical protein